MPAAVLNFPGPTIDPVRDMENAAFASAIARRIASQAQTTPSHSGRPSELLKLAHPFEDGSNVYSWCVHEHGGIAPTAFHYFRSEAEAMQKFPLARCK
jgi:hypothetical protein